MNIALDICLRTIERVKKEIDNVDGRISVSKTESKSSSVCLYLTKPDNVLPIIQINVDVVDTELEKNEIAICIIGTLAEQENDVPFTDISAKSDSHQKNIIRCYTLLFLLTTNYKTVNLRKEASFDFRNYVIAYLLL